MNKKKNLKYETKSFQIIHFYFEKLSFYANVHSKYLAVLTNFIQLYMLISSSYANKTHPTYFLINGVDKWLIIFVNILNTPQIKFLLFIQKYDLSTNHKLKYNTVKLLSNTCNKIYDQSVHFSQVNDYYFIFILHFVRTVQFFIEILKKKCEIN